MTPCLPPRFAVLRGPKRRKKTDATADSARQPPTDQSPEPQPRGLPRGTPKMSAVTRSESRGAGLQFHACAPAPRAPQNPWFRSQSWGPDLTLDQAATPVNAPATSLAVRD